MVMLDNSKIELYDVLGIHLQTLIAIAKNQRLFIPSWKNIVIPESKEAEKEIERAWRLLPVFANPILEVKEEEKAVVVRFVNGILRIAIKNKKERRRVLGLLKHLPLDVFA